MIILAGILILCGAAGIAAAVKWLRGRKPLFVLCVTLCAVIVCVCSAFIWLSIYFGWAVSHQEAKEPPAEEAYVLDEEAPRTLSDIRTDLI